MSKPRILGYAGSTYVRTTRMAFEEKGVAYELEQIGHDEIEKRGLHPFVKMPVMVHGDFTLFESLAIVEYVDENFDGPSLHPADARERAVMYQWISAINDYFYPDAIRGFVLAKKFGGDPEDIEAAAGRVQHHFRVVDRALRGRTFLCGETPSLADLYLAPIHAYVHMMPEGPGMLADFGDLRGFGEAMAARPSFVNTAP